MGVAGHLGGGGRRMNVAQFEMGNKLVADRGRFSMRKESSEGY